MASRRDFLAAAGASALGGCSTFMPVETAREEVSPQADAALAATEETRIAMARIRGCALETAPQPVVRRFACASDLGIPDT